ncbi:MAP kinase kinase (MEK) [Teratosphaeriaceae sp. CCFEE 6253]|nr:MAP kinase kinase (MEK) [Teratosphaeriaceae sp. CCFEE 6253]
MNESGDVTMCMEYADVGSLDSISKNFGPVRVDVLGKIAEAVLGGLTYLYTVHKIMHRDIKPSNVLVNSKGQIKLCDFGVSSELENSVADTFVGTGTYMAPERIQGSPYTVKSDVWSVGLTLMELAIGKFPFSIENDEDDEDAAGPQGILDLLQQIVLEPSPKLPKSDAFPRILEDVIDKCLLKNPAQRPTPKELFDTDPFLQAAKRTPVDLEQWAVSMMERHNRKSHLAPQLSPVTKALLRGEETPRTASTTKSAGSSSGQSVSTLPTPTSGEMPISAGLSKGLGRDVRGHPFDNVVSPTGPGLPNGLSREQITRPQEAGIGNVSGRPSHPMQPLNSSYESRSRQPDYPHEGGRARPAYPVQPASSSYESRSRPAETVRDGMGSRPAFPARTSSAQTMQAGAAYGAQQPMQLPIRQAPPSSRSNGRPAAENAGGERDGNHRRPNPGFVQ